jgi:hypothetical protein
VEWAKARTDLNINGKYTTHPPTHPLQLTFSAALFHIPRLPATSLLSFSPSPLTLALNTRLVTGSPPTTSRPSWPSRLVGKLPGDPRW